MTVFSVIYRVLIPLTTRLLSCSKTAKPVAVDRYRTTIILTVVVNQGAAKTLSKATGEKTRGRKTSSKKAHRNTSYHTEVQHHYSTYTSRQEATETMSTKYRVPNRIR